MAITGSPEASWYPADSLDPTAAATQVYDEASASSAAVMALLGVLELSSPPMFPPALARPLDPPGWPPAGKPEGAPTPERRHCKGVPSAGPAGGTAGGELPAARYSTMEPGTTLAGSTRPEAAATRERTGYSSRSRSS